jgi:YVTN family beta-propeller protein
MDPRPSRRTRTILVALAVAALLPACTRGAAAVPPTTRTPIVEPGDASPTGPTATSTSRDTPTRSSSSSAPNNAGSGPPSTSSNVYAAITAKDTLAPQVNGVPTRVYVPDNDSNDVRVIDPKTFRVVKTISVGAEPQHVTPAWNLRSLYVGDVYSNTLTVIDPRTARAVRTIAMPDPYNLYFTPNGRHAIDVAEGRDTLYFYDPRTWKLQTELRIPFRGPDHLDFSRDGSYLLISTEYAGAVVKVGLDPPRVMGSIALGGSTVDIKLAPLGRVFYVANQNLGGVFVIDGDTMQQVRFIPTGAGAHGFAIARDAIHLYVSNRLAGTISVIDTRTRRVVHRWDVGGSPDMLQVSADGSRLWVSNRYDASVSVIDTRTGAVLHVIPVGMQPHGLTLFPQPGRFSLGHNGVYR